MVLFLSHCRMDTTLVDFKDMKWERGDLSFLFDGKKLGSQSLLVMDNEAKVYQWIRDVSGFNVIAHCIMSLLFGSCSMLCSTEHVTNSSAK